MDWSLIVALYAAVVATTSVIWQVFLWRAEHAGELSVRVDADWSLREEAITVAITNRNSYDVPLSLAKISARQSDRSYISWSAPIDLDRFGLTKVISARSTVRWRMDRTMLIKAGPPLGPGLSLVSMSDVTVTIYTGVGRTESASAKIINVDELSRPHFAKAVGELSEICEGDMVRIRATSGNAVNENEGRVGSVEGLSLAGSPKFQVVFDDNSSVHVPIADVELVTSYDDRLKEFLRAFGP
jgi:hypothetical protein